MLKYYRRDKNKDYIKSILEDKIKEHSIDIHDVKSNSQRIIDMLEDVAATLVKEKIIERIFS